MTHTAGPKSVKKRDDEEWLNINLPNSTVVAFTKITKLEELGALHLRGVEIQLPGEVKYLAVILDPRMAWNRP